MIHSCRVSINMRPRQNGRHFAQDIFICISFDENVGISILISLKIVPKDPVNDIPIIGSDNGIATTSWQAIIWTNGG